MKLLTAAVIAVTFATTALASGPQIPYEPPVTPLPAIASYNWAGAYAGLGVTYARGGMSDAFSPPDNPDTRGAGLSLIAGYNWQNGNIVYGGEVALDFSRRNGMNDCGVGGGFTCASYQNNHASIRGRVGVAMDRSLLFVTAGYATDLRRIQHSFAGIPFFNAGARFDGPMIGIGFERAVANDWTVRGDLEHYFLGTEVFGPYTIDGDITLVRVSLIRRF